MGQVGLSRAVRSMGLSLALCLVALGGCNGTNSPFGMSDYAVAADDSCGPQRQALKAYQDYFFASMIQGAVVGAGVGALTGYLTGGSSQATAIGAGTGAVAGAVAGYYQAKQKANNDPVAVTDSVYQDVTRENQQIDGVSLAFTNLRNCRIESAQAVKGDYAAGRISRDDATAKLQRIRQLYLEDTDFAASLGSKMAERGNEYQYASNQILDTNPGARQELAESPAVVSGPQLVANEAARVRESPSTSSAQVEMLSAGETVTEISGGNAPADWRQVSLPDGRTGFVASRLVRPAGTAAPPPPPREDAAGVAQLTESNQLKQKALTDQVADAKTQANGSDFELSGGISRIRPTIERSTIG